MNKVYCPYCGAEMVLRDWQDIFFGKGNFYECVCGAKSPIKVSPDTAHAAAMTRYVEPNRVLTWGELVERIKLYPVWLEDKTYPRCSEWVNPEEEPYTEWELEMAEQAYGKFVRAWLRRPTEEERAEAGWNQ